MSLNVITGGNAYTDIDVLACVAAYKQLLTLQGKHAVGVVSPIYNQTITTEIARWNPDVQNTWNAAQSAAQFVVMDVSDPQHFFDFVTLDNVSEIFDHHYGHGDFWKNRLGGHACIEAVGACATLVWEKFREHRFENKISLLNANLLYTAILANTLDFKSSMTNPRDQKAFEELSSITTLPWDWKEQYYLEVQKSVQADITGSLLKDTKSIRHGGKNLYFGQLELWNAQKIIPQLTQKDSIERITGGLPESSPTYLINVVSIEENCSYLFTNQQHLQEQIRNATHGTKTSSGLVTPRLWQRKELLKIMQGK